MNLELLEKQDSQTDRHLILNDINWQQYIDLDRVLEDVPGLRLTYCQEFLEIMILSPQHEREKTIIGRLLETYALARNLDLHGCGSTTYRNEAEARGLEPDECYCVGDLKNIPDFALEVIVTSGGLNKLQVYLGLGVKEVWFWQQGKFSLYCLQGGTYNTSEKSKFLPDLDLNILANFVQPDNQPTAVREFFKSLQ
ncbi:Uma2 family endonuclease [Oscillatoria sp. FACHB-1406]|uniref:Uma2 family endonuclease n=1 Tax=Oscillatoria sp. FACHB-1406 TaxID=2692846 RepID=UPI00168A0A0D|nr:Uma2 family endonuclease [Oscillatoria sp. FACHB-1406]MBD2579623.1 Uma2 family endonuclease [Oscillatoria sp. FACHB-1406]